MPLTDVAIRAAKPRAKPYKMTDEKGLYLLVKPGGGKLWQFKYRMGKKERNLSIGPYPDITLAIARERRLEARRLLTEGIDPSQYKQQRAKQAALDAASSFRAVAAEYLTQSKKQGLADITVAKKRWVLEQLVFPRIGERHIRELKPSDILAVLTAIEASGRLETAKRARQHIGSGFPVGFPHGSRERRSYAPPARSDSGAQGGELSCRHPRRPVRAASAQDRRLQAPDRQLGIAIHRSDVRPIGRASICEVG